MARDISALIAEMTIEEKASLTAGASMWSTHAVERLAIPAITVTDGPAGARGPAIPGIGPQVATLCIPCGSALGATFDGPLLNELGIALGHQARSKGARVLLAPTVNLHRSPLFGRAFECYSEDPLLSGKLAASFIRGVQSQNVATTVKHFVGNDAEFERMTINSVIDERTLREIYLLPFEIAVREGQTLGIMTAYNRMNGLYCAENRHLLNDILRQEWGFEGFVVTDWFAAATTQGAARAGLDLEMPAPARMYGSHLARAVDAGQVDEADLDRAAHTLLSLYDRLGALDDLPITPQAIDLGEHRSLARRASIASIVLLRNEKVQDTPLLPFSSTGLKTIAVIGPNAERTRIMGGGSAEVQPHHKTSIIDVLHRRLGDKVDIKYEAGGSIDKSTPLLDLEFDVVVFDGPIGSTKELTRLTRPNGRVILVARNDPGVPTSAYNFRARAQLQVERSGQYLISLVEISPCQLFVDDNLVIDGATIIPKRGSAFFGLGSEEVIGVVELTAAVPHEIILQCDGTNKQWAHGAQIGLQYIESVDPITCATDLAAECDIAIVVVGTTSEWESEGHDRLTLDLPGRQVELIRCVAAVNKRTVVLVNSGAPVNMSWVDDVPAVMQVWFGGQEMSHAIVDVLFGDADPGGRLPTTIPHHLQDTPAFGNFPGEYGQVRYGEGLLVGYRWYEARHIPVRYPFGYGLSYSTFAINEPTINVYETKASDLERNPLMVQVPIVNTGRRTATHVVQLYVAAKKSRIQRPVQELKAFSKVDLNAGEVSLLNFELSFRDFAYWDPGDSYQSSLQTSVTGERSQGISIAPGSWKVDAGLYEIRLGHSSKDIAQTLLISIQPEDQIS